MKALLAGWGGGEDDDDDDDNDDDDDDVEVSEREDELNYGYLDHIVLAAPDLSVYGSIQKLHLVEQQQ
jgi:hypothetical protein